MNSLNRIFSIFVFTTFTTVSCFDAETSTNTTDTKNDTKHVLTFDNNNGINLKVEILQKPCFSNFYKYRILVEIANNSSAPITVSAKLFKNISQTHINKMDQIKSAILAPFAGLLTVASTTFIESLGLLHGLKYLSNYIEHLHKYPHQQYLYNHIPQISLAIGGITAVATFIVLSYNIYKGKFYYDGISTEQTIEPNKVGFFAAYISKNDFEKLEKRSLIPELDIKKSE